MTASSRFIDYMGRGLAANLPAATSITFAAATAAFYWATDTLTLYCLNAGATAWQTISAGGIEVSDGTNDFTGITKLLFSGAVVSNPTTGEAEVAISGGGGTPWDFSPPHASSFTLSNNGSTNVTLADDTQVGMQIDGGVPDNSATSRRAEVAIPTPGADWTFQTKVKAWVDGIAYSGFGIIAVDSSGNVGRLSRDNSNILQVASIGTSYYSENLIGGFSLEWYRIRWVQSTGTLYYEVSADGKLWTTFYSNTPSGIGMSSNPAYVGFMATYSRSSGSHVTAVVPYATLTGATL